MRPTPSDPPDSSHRPSGENASPFTQPLWAGITRISVLFWSDQKRIAP